MNEEIFKKIKTYQIKPQKEFNEKEFMKKIISEMAYNDDYPADIFDLKLNKVELKFRNVLAVTEKVHISYQGSIGYKREEEYWDKEKKWDNKTNDYYYENVKKTRTITDWQPYKGEDTKLVTGFFDDFNAEKAIFFKNKNNDAYLEAKRKGNNYSQYIFKLLSEEENLEAEEVNFEFNDNTLPNFREMMDGCRKHIEQKLYLTYGTSDSSPEIPGDEKKLRYTHNALEYVEFVCCRVPIYAVEYTYQDETYKCYWDISSSGPKCDIPQMSVVLGYKDRENYYGYKDRENYYGYLADDQTKNMKTLVKVLWGLVIGGLVVSLPLCFAHFYFGWIIVALLISLSIYFNLLYEKKWNTIYSNEKEDYTFNLRKDKLECLTAAIEEKRIMQLDDKEIEEFKAYVEEAKNKTKWTIRRAFSDNDRLRAFIFLTIFALIFIAFCSIPAGIEYIKEYNHSPERISIEWVDKQNVSNDQLNITFEIDCKKVEISKLVFEMLVYKDGKKVGTLTTTYNDAELKAGKEKQVTFTWKNNGENTFFEEVKKSEISKFTYEIIITQIVFEDDYKKYSK